MTTAPLTLQHYDGEGALRQQLRSIGEGGVVAARPLQQKVHRVAARSAVVGHHAAALHLSAALLTIAVITTRLQQGTYFS